MENNTTTLLTILPLKELLVFPGMIVNLDIGRDRSIHAVEEGMQRGRKLILVTQKKAAKADPALEDLYTYGVLADIKQLLKLPNGALRLLVEGVKRVKVEQCVDSGKYYEAQAQVLEDVCDNVTETTALKRLLLDKFEKWTLTSRKVNSDVMLTFKNQKDPGRVADLVAGYLSITIEEKEKVLEAINVRERLNLLYMKLAEEVEISTLEKSIAQRVQKAMEKNQREYYLKEQLKVIHEELGLDDDIDTEITQYKERIAKLNLPKEIVEKLEKELGHLAKMNSMQPDVAVIRNYLDAVLDLPWGKFTTDNRDLKQAAKILDEDHYGLKKVKERILEYLAVRTLTQDNKGPILCLVGPPGVGKTSLARSIARAVDRKFTQVSLGGIRDEAEIRGHRRTYIGSMPGRIIHGMQTCGTMNPVFLLDEVDKMAADFRGDPASALLEALDPEQNCHFSDHFIELPFDLSNVFWIVTANTVETIPPALLDRLEVLELVSYTEEEKLNIAQLHLLPKERKAHGLTSKSFSITQPTLEQVIRGYTREAGVRALERQIATLCRKAAYKIINDNVKSVRVTEKNYTTLLGPIPYREEDLTAKREIGICTGLAWTQVGGEVLKVEAVATEGSGKLNLTGQLGDVMKESAQAGFTYVRSRAASLGITDKINEKTDIHIHVPEGATPKDGPSAGVTMITALVSALSGRYVRAGIAMTGEITLSGKVLPVGGIKEKMLAAARYHVQKVLLPEHNMQDLEELPAKVRESMEFVPVKHMDEVLRIALEE